MKQQLVWYLSYGSNLSEDRFMAYIKGGTPIGSTKVERGCRDQSEPQKNEFIEIPFPLYFAHYSGRWKGGPAFISKEANNQEKTIARMYLITKEQFEDVVAQENNLNSASIDLNNIKDKKSQTLFPTLYGTIFHIGTKDKYDIFSFTSSEKFQDVVFTKPSISYLNMILSGILSSGTVKKTDAIAYLYEKPGVRENYTLNELLTQL